MTDAPIAKAEIGGQAIMIVELTPAYAAVQDLINRHSDAKTKLAEFEHAMEDIQIEEQRLPLRKSRAMDAIRYQTERMQALERRIRTAREAIRATEDDASGIFS